MSRVFQNISSSRVLTIPTGQYLTDEQWEHGDFNKRLQSKISELQYKIEKAIDKLDDRNMPYTVHEIKKQVVRNKMESSHSTYICGNVMKR